MSATGKDAPQAVAMTTLTLKLTLGDQAAGETPEQAVVTVSAPQADRWRDQLAIVIRYGLGHTSIPIKGVQHRYSGEGDRLAERPVMLVLSPEGGYLRGTLPGNGTPWFTERFLLCHLPTEGSARPQSERPRPSDADYRQCAFDLFHDAGSCEVDESASVRRHDDRHGAFVQAWLWLDDEQVTDT